MIWSVTSGPHNKEPLLRRWRRGDLAEQPTVATAALAVVLGACLLGAAAMVTARSVQAQVAARQAEVGADIVQRVSEGGLSSYLPDKPEWIYYLLKEGEDVVGYAASHLAPIKGAEGAVIFKGRRLRWSVREKTLETVSFWIGNDLRQYGQEELIRNRDSGFAIRMSLLMSEGALSGAINVAGNRFNVRSGLIEGGNVIPEFMRDFFMSVAVNEQVGEDAVFQAPYIRLEEGEGVVVQLQQMAVSRGEGCPEEVRQIWPYGNCAEVVEYAATKARERVFYDSNHQLVWRQESWGRGLVQIAVTRDELMRDFPKAAAEVDRWLQRFEDDDDAELR